MKVFVAGATGAIRKQLVPRLVAAGYEVDGMTRSESRQAMPEDLGAVPVVADALDPNQVADAVGRAKAEVILQQLTAIRPVDMRHFDRDLVRTSRLRTDGTDYLLPAECAVGLRRLVAQATGSPFGLGCMDTSWLIRFSGMNLPMSCRHGEGSESTIFGSRKSMPMAAVMAPAV
jgi:uncharacterized protein YbjT (DUF2867 family)